MLKRMSPSKMIQIWFVSVASIAAAALAFGVALTLASWSMILAICLVPPTMLYKLWPDNDARTTAEVIYDADQSR
jgi:4-hydroxybenzoate polyprenyltransferase